MENPFYAGRKPERQIYSGLRKFIDVLSLSMGVALESNAVRKWLIDNYDVTNIVRVGNLKLKKNRSNHFFNPKKDLLAYPWEVTQQQYVRPYVHPLCPAFLHIVGALRLVFGHEELFQIELISKNYKLILIRIWIMNYS